MARGLEFLASLVMPWNHVRFLTLLWRQPVRADTQMPRRSKVSALGAAV